MSNWSNWQPSHEAFAFWQSEGALTRDTLAVSSKLPENALYMPYGDDLLPRGGMYVVEHGPLEVPEYHPDRALPGPLTCKVTLKRTHTIEDSVATDEGTAIHGTASLALCVAGLEKERRLRVLERPRNRFVGLIVPREQADEQQPSVVLTRVDYDLTPTDLAIRKEFEQLAYDPSAILARRIFKGWLTTIERMIAYNKRVDRHRRQNG